MIKHFLIILLTLSLIGSISVSSVYAANVDLGLPQSDTSGGILNTSASNAVSGTNLDYNPSTNYPTVNPPSGSKLSVAGLVGWIISLIDYVIKFILVLSLVAFLWGIFRLVFLDATKETERAKAKNFMVWGIVALFVMVSVWGLVNVLRSSIFGTGSLIIPQLK